MIVVCTGWMELACREGCQLGRSSLVTGWIGAPRTEPAPVGLFFSTMLYNIVQAHGLRTESTVPRRFRLFACFKVAAKLPKEESNCCSPWSHAASYLNSG